eukprot:403349456
MESLNHELKTALIARIVNFKESQGVVFYTVNLSKIYSGDQHQLEKRYSQFYALNESLKTKNYLNLPKFPQKTILAIKSQDSLHRRRQELNDYIKGLVNRKDTRNIKDLIKFLELDKFCPELLIKKPKLVEIIQCQGNGYFYVSQCHFIPKHNIFLLCLNDKYKKNSKLEVYSFRQTAVVRDSYVIKAATSFTLPEAPILRAFSFSGCLGQKFIGPSNISSASNRDSGRSDNPQNPLEALQQAQNPNNNHEDILKDVTKASKVEKLLEYVFNTQIKAMTYCEEMDLISIGFRDGKIQSFYLSVEIDKEDIYAEDDDEFNHDYTNNGDNSNFGNPIKVQDLTQKGKSLKPQNLKSKALQLKNNAADGTVLLKKAFEQIEDYDYEEMQGALTPLKVNHKLGGGKQHNPHGLNGGLNKSSNTPLGRAGGRSRMNTSNNVSGFAINNKQFGNNTIKNQYQQYDIDTEKHYLEFSRHSSINAHKQKIVGMALERTRGFLYSIGYDKRINIIDITEKKIVFTMKGFNAQFRALCIDEQLKRLYVSSCEGQLIFFNIQGIIPIIVHSLTLPTDQGYVKSLELDIQRNIMFCLTSTSCVLIVQLDIKNEKNSTVVATIQNPFEAQEFVSKLAWLPRMSSYVDASSRGRLRFCDPEAGGECMFVLPTDFHERISCLHYCKEKNVLFAGAKDGKFRVWKVPSEWRSKQIDEVERDYEFSRKQVILLQQNKQKQAVKQQITHQVNTQEKHNVNPQIINDKEYFDDNNNISGEFEVIGDDNKNNKGNINHDQHDGDFIEFSPDKIDQQDDQNNNKRFSDELISPDKIERKKSDFVLWDQK